jgi:glycosyltransferase involved in cell wall biosynthesis
LPLAFLARALRKPIVIVAGGYDLANVPEIAYGNMRTRVGRLLSRTLFGLADLVLCYSNSAAAEARAAGVDQSKMHVLHLGVRTPEGLPTTKSPFVLTVAGIDEATITRKGLLDVARVAKLLPDVEFVLAGVATNPEALERLTRESPPNLKLCGYVQPEALHSLFSRAAAYLQPSRHEAFGLSVAEAMSHGCAVIVGDRYSLPEVVGDCGILVDPQDDEAICTALRDALARCRPVPEAAARIKDLFPPERRARKLLEHVESLVG